MRRSGSLLLLVLALGCVSCTDTPAAGPCETRLAGGVCVGVTRPDVCAGTYCTDGVACKATFRVDQASGAASADGSTQRPYTTLSPAAARATAGDCIALAAGTYDGATLKGGVSLLGVGAARVTITGQTGGVATLAVDRGSGGTLRGFTLSGNGPGLLLDGVDDLRVEQIRVAKASTTGIDARTCTRLVLEHVEVREARQTTASADGGVDISSPDAAASGDAGRDAGPSDTGSDTSSDAGAGDTGGHHGIGILLANSTSATISSCLVKDSGTQGILVHDSAATLEDTLVERSGRYGVVLGCATGCPGDSTIQGVTITNAAGVGLLVTGGTVIASSNDINGIQYDKGIARGIHVQGKAVVTLLNNHVRHSEGQGVVVDDSTGQLTQNRVESNQERGMVVQNVAAPGLTLDANEVTGNERAALTFISSAAVTVKGGRYADTKGRLVTMGQDNDTVGDGVQVLGQSVVSIDGATIDANFRLGVLIDASRATVASTSITGGKAALVVQNAKLDDQSFNMITGSGGAVVTPTTSSIFLVNPGALISNLPLPIP